MSNNLIKKAFFSSDGKQSEAVAKIEAMCMYNDIAFCGVLHTNQYHVMFDVSDASTELLKRSERFVFKAYIQNIIVHSQMIRTWRQSEEGILRTRS